MDKYLLNDQLLLKKLFSYDYEKKHVDTKHFVSFHKQMIENILAEVGIEIAKFDDISLSEAGKASFYNVGYFLKDATYIGNGVFIVEKMIDYRTDVFEIMSFIAINIIRNMPILSVSIDDGYIEDDLSKAALNNPNEFSVLSLYDELSKLYCLEYGLPQNKVPFLEKLKKVIFERQKFILGDDSYNLFRGLLSAGD